MVADVLERARGEPGITLDPSSATLGRSRAPRVSVDACTQILSLPPFRRPRWPEPGRDDRPLVLLAEPAERGLPERHAEWASLAVREGDRITEVRGVILTKDCKVCDPGQRPPSSDTP